MGLLAAICALVLLAGVVNAQQSAPTPRPNIVIIFPHDVGWQNVSDHGLGTMGYRTPNIDPIARERTPFTDRYAQPSSAAAGGW